MPPVLTRDFRDDGQPRAYRSVRRGNHLRGAEQFVEQIRRDTHVEGQKVHTGQ